MASGGVCFDETPACDSPAVFKLLEAALSCESPPSRVSAGCFLSASTLNTAYRKAITAMANATNKRCIFLFIFWGDQAISIFIVFALISIALDWRRGGGLFSGRGGRWRACIKDHPGPVHMERVCIIERYAHLRKALQGLFLDFRRQGLHFRAEPSRRKILHPHRF